MIRELTRLPLCAIVTASVFLNVAASAQTETVLYRFQGGNDGANPQAALIQDNTGNLYGTTTYGGGSPACVLFVGKTVGCGTVFMLSPNSSGGWTETLLHSFQGGSDGAEPLGELTMDSKGNLYGTTIEGGSSLCNGVGCGTVFQLTPPSSPGGSWTETLLYAFQGGNDGAAPESRLVLNQGGSLYGTTAIGGGSPNCPYWPGCGTIFELSPPAISGQAWTETVLYSFDDKTSGAYPNAGVTFDANGNLLGTTQFGGLGPNGGTVFQASPTATSGSWTVRTLYSFQRGSDGAQPSAGVVVDKTGNIFGTTFYGGGGRCYNGGVFGCGSVFELVPPTTVSGTWLETQVDKYPTGRDGRYPEAGLIFDSSGNLYGSTSEGGTGRYGDVFKLTPPSRQGGAWTRTVVYVFQGGSDGRNPQGNLLLLKGTLYGTTNIGGEVACSVNGGQGCGTIFQIVP